VTLLLPRGVVGTVHYWWGELKARRQAAATAPETNGVPNGAPRAAE
jgi:hypothetical protein